MGKNNLTLLVEASLKFFLLELGQAKQSAKKVER